VHIYRLLGGVLESAIGQIRPVELRTLGLPIPVYLCTNLFGIPVGILSKMLNLSSFSSSTAVRLAWLALPTSFVRRCCGSSSGCSRSNYLPRIMVAVLVAVARQRVPGNPLIEEECERSPELWVTRLSS
jgi:hypothetical protein